MEGETATTPRKEQRMDVRFTKALRISPLCNSICVLKSIFEGSPARVSERGGARISFSRRNIVRVPGGALERVTTSSHPLPKFLYSPVMVFAARRALRSSEKFQRRHNVIKKYFYVSRSAEGGGLEKKIERGEGIFVERFDFNYEQRSYTFWITAIPPVLLYFSCEEERVAECI